MFDEVINKERDFLCRRSVATCRLSCVLRERLGEWLTWVLTAWTQVSILDSDPTETFSQQMQHTLDDMHAREVLTDKAYEFLSPADRKPARFYHQPKLHKESIPGRPIVSGNGSPTEDISLSLLITSSNLLFHRLLFTSTTPQTFSASLKPLRTRSPALPSLELLMCPPYTPTFPMMKVFRHATKHLAESGHTSPPIDDLKALMYEVLTKNNFTFMDDHYLQIFGTSMGTRIAQDGSFICMPIHVETFNNRCWTLLPVVSGYGGASSMMFSSFGPVKKKVFILLLTTSTPSTEPSNSPQKFITNRSTSWMCPSARSITLWSLIFTLSLQIFTSTFTLPVAILATVRMVLLDTVKLSDSVAFALMTLISPVIHKTSRCT